MLPALQRLSDAFDLLATCKLSPAALIAAAGLAPTAGQVAAFAAAVRSRYSEADWLSAVQAINDQLRRQQRDALVAHVLLTSGPDILATLGIATTPNRVPTSDDLFSYFLVDADMQPCMLTSRIRHALSSIQLFVERCLRNLEPAVNPNDLDAGEWVWRSRYRVWQANREVFLWPENWMDESLRDDQSPFFKTAMSQLLQSDITDDTAASAYLDYLSNLEQVAQLEPCGLYVEAATDGSGDDTVHVVARSAGSHRKHYYRRFASGAWTPWADTKLSIEDNPVVPYVWNGRLLLFWVQVHRTSTVSAANPGATLPSHVSGEPHLADATLSGLSGPLATSAAQATGEQIGIVLCFSEFYNGAWQPVKTSDTAAPMYFQTVPSGTFDRSSLDLRPWRSSDPNDQSLYVQIAERNYQPALNPVFLFLDHGFVVHNTHSAPVPASSSTARIHPVQPGRMRALPPASGAGATTLSAGYSTEKTGSPWGPQYPSPASVHLLTGTLPLSVRQAQTDVNDQWSMPFFAADARSAFFVTTSVSYRWFGQYEGYALAGPGRILQDGGLVRDTAPVVVNRPPTQPDPPVEITDRLADPALAQSPQSQQSEQSEEQK